MGRCCGGKNAGKPISWSRYALGLGVFCGYHGAIGALLHVAAVPNAGWRKVRDFHKDVCLDELRQILLRQDVNVGGVAPQPDDPSCPVDAGPPA